MFDCEIKVSVDGRDTEKFLTVSCLGKDVCKDGFVVSENIANQAFTIQSFDRSAADNVCKIQSSELDTQFVLSVQSNSNSENTVSVIPSQSGLYRVVEYVSSQINITINVLRSVICTFIRRVQKIIESMKGKQKRLKVYSLCLLRL